MKNTDTSKKTDIHILTEQIKREALNTTNYLQEIIDKQPLDVEYFKKEIFQVSDGILDTNDDLERGIKKSEYLKQFKKLSEHIEEKKEDLRNTITENLYQDAVDTLKNPEKYNTRIIEAATKFVHIYDGKQKITKAIDEFNKVADQWLSVIHQAVYDTDLVAETTDHHQA